MVLLSSFNYLVAAFFSVSRAAVWRRESQDPQASVLYFIANNDTQNAVIAIPVGRDGKLLQNGVTVTPTGGLGGSILDFKTLQPFTPDSLNSQNSIVREREYLFAVNAGSSTLSMLKIDSRNPTKLTVVGTPVNTLGDFPVAVAASSKINQACVANTGAIAGVACFDYSPTGLSPLSAGLTPFNLNQTNPPVGPQTTVGTTFFNNDATALYTTLKSSITTPLPFVVNPVINDKVSIQSIQTVPQGSLFMFGATALPHTTNVFVSDADQGALVLAINQQNWTTATLKATTISGQVASCWAVHSATTNTVFITDGGRNHIYELTVDGALIRDYTFAQNSLHLDPWAAGGFLYSLAFVNRTAAIAVFDIGGGPGTAKLVQEYYPVGASIQSQGMAVWTE